MYQLFLWQMGRRYVYFLTPALNSQGLKKLRYAMQTYYYYYLIRSVRIVIAGGST